MVFFGLRENCLFLECSDAAISIGAMWLPIFQQVLSIMCESQAYGQRGGLCSVGSDQILKETGMKMDKHSIAKVGLMALGTNEFQGA